MSMSGKQNVSNDGKNITLRKVQAYHGERSMTIVLPREFAVNLGIAKGDYLKVRMENNRLILEKAEIG
jgi:hypothetical protein